MVEQELVHVAGKRKAAVARATLKSGSGIVRINSIPLELYKPFLAREKIKEALMLAGSIPSTVDIDVVVEGGGVVGQTDATRLAIAKALVSYSGDEKLKEKYLAYDRHILIADYRRRETRKPGASKARAAAQKSKR